MGMSTPPIPPVWKGRLGALAPRMSAAWRGRIRKVFLVLAVLLALYAALGFLVVPRIARAKIESLAAAQLGRKATVGKVEFNPFSLRARISDFVLAGRDPGHALLRFDTMDVDVSAESLWRRAPVFDEIRLVRPQLEVARDAHGALSVQDLLDRPAKPGSPGRVRHDRLHAVARS